MTRLVCSGCDKPIRTALFSVDCRDVYHPGCLETEAGHASVYLDGRRINGRGHLSERHPLASVARRNCSAHPTGRRYLVGGVACGQCWEAAIRTDERFAVEFGLGELDRDPEYIDIVAVERALAGRRVPLTNAERAEVEARRAARPTPMPDAVLAA